MLLDTQDQEIVDQLPDLSELHATYGVQVNAIPVSELFALYERTGFLYPDKAARLTPHIEQVRENWRRMLRGGESLLYVLTAGDEERGRASLAVWRTTLNGWMSQHLVSESNPYASRAVMLDGSAASILKGVAESHQNWFRPENRFPTRVFGTMVETIGESHSSVSATHISPSRGRCDCRQREGFAPYPTIHRISRPCVRSLLQHEGISTSRQRS